MMGLLGLAALWASAQVVSADDCAHSACPTALWWAAQLLPSPAIYSGAGGFDAGLRWQLTPLLYSWGVHTRRSPWRTFIAEPNARYGGAVELYLSPEVLFADGGARWLVRPGVRAYWALMERGETLSASLGVSAQHLDGRTAGALEGGLYMLFGIVGWQASWAPGADDAALIFTLRLRYL